MLHRYEQFASICCNLTPDQLWTVGPESCTWIILTKGPYLWHPNHVPKHKLIDTPQNCQRKNGKGCLIPPCCVPTTIKIVIKKRSLQAINHAGKSNVHCSLSLTPTWPKASLASLQPLTASLLLIEVYRQRIMKKHEEATVLPTS